MRLSITLLLASILCFSGWVSMSIRAYYTPWNMTRPQFEAAAQFGAWEQGSDGPTRTFVLETPDATITGRDTMAVAGEGRAPFGDVHLKPFAIARMMAIYILLSAAVVWGVAWLFGYFWRKRPDAGPEQRSPRE